MAKNATYLYVEKKNPGILSISDLTLVLKLSSSSYNKAGVSTSIEISYSSPDGIISLISSLYNLSLFSKFKLSELDKTL